MSLKLTWQGHCLRVQVMNLHHLAWNLGKHLHQSVSVVEDMLYSEAIVQNDLCVVEKK